MYTYTKVYTNGLCIQWPINRRAQLAIPGHLQNINFYKKFWSKKLKSLHFLSI